MRATFLFPLLLGLPLGTAAAEDLPLLGPAHVGIQVSDLEKSRAFYGGVLGYEEAFDAKTPDGQIAVAFFKVNDRQFIELSPGLAADEVAPMTHVAMATDDIQKLHAMIEARGMPMDRSARNRRRKPPLRDPRSAGPKPETPGVRPVPARFAAGQDAGKIPQPTADLHASGARGNHRHRLRGRPSAFTSRSWDSAETGAANREAANRFWTIFSTAGSQPATLSNCPSKPRPLARAAAGMASTFRLTVPDHRGGVPSLRLDRGLTKVRTAPKFGLDQRWQFNLFDPDGTRRVYATAGEIRQLSRESRSPHNAR